MVKERKRPQYGWIRHGLDNSKAQRVNQVAITNETGSRTIHEGKEEVQRALRTNISARYSQGNNLSFSSGQLLDGLGYMDEWSAVEPILKNSYVFPEDCPKEAREFCKQASILYHKVAKEVMQRTITKKIFQKW